LFKLNLRIVMIHDFDERPISSNFSMPVKPINALNVARVPPEHSFTPGKSGEDYVDELPVHRIEGTSSIYYLVTRHVMAK